VVESEYIFFLASSRSVLLKPQLQPVTYPTSSTLLFFLIHNRTHNNRRTYVLRGELVAQPFATSVRSKPSVSDMFGKVNTILNPPNAERVSTYRSKHNKVAVTVQTAGTTHKRKVPFSVNAPRNRLNNPEKKRPPPFASTLDLNTGGIANSTVYPYRTISRTVQRPTAHAMETRIGCKFYIVCGAPHCGFFTNTPLTPLPSLLH